METAFYVLANSDNSTFLNNVALNLTPEKPVLVEDVEPDWKELYLALEFIPLPRKVRLFSEHFLMICWSVNFDFVELESLVASLIASGVHVVNGAVRVEDGSVFLVETSPEFGVVYEPIEHTFLDDDDLVEWLHDQAKLQ
nr:hypothetical protein [uncultured Pseudomonas sp.]